jgi:glutathione S-transferase
MLTLYVTAASIYCAKVRLALAMKDMAVVEVPPPGGYRSSAYRAMVPQGTVPAIDHDGFILWESDAIIEYLDDIAPEVPLLPSDIRLRAKARAMSRFLDIRVEPAARSLFPLVGSGERNARSDALDAALRILEAQADPRPLLSGAAMSLPDCGCLPLFCVIDLLERELSLDLRWPRWAATYRAAAARMAEVEKVLADYRRALDDWASSRAASFA